MITVGIAIVAGLCYWFAWYQLAFWILIYAIVYGVLDAVRAIIKANDISRGGLATGAEPTFARSVTFATNNAPSPNIAVNAKRYLTPAPQSKCSAGLGRNGSMNPNVRRARSRNNTMTFIYCAVSRNR